tara:strand:+ start:877 stop:1536 length:660 start_codon:yes stop_codon:yes gene_type:complete
MKKYNFIFDFDSTILKYETIEILADFALVNNVKKETILTEIKDMTTLAMNGKMSFSKALEKRISLMNLDKSHINDTILYLHNKLSDSFYDNIENFSKIIDNTYVVSGGFKEIIIPLLTPFGFKEDNIFANSFIVNNNNDLSIDMNNSLSKDKGKIIVAEKINGKKIIIGDGYTDYELKKFGLADTFILFTENVYRKNLSEKADLIAQNFNEVFNYINNE